MDTTLNELFRKVILYNEVDGNEKAILRFSDPDGPSGRSGWSFGLCQFDTRHNDMAVACLKECGFTDEEISGVVNQSISIKPLEAKLNACIVAKYDTAQLSQCLNAALNVTTSNGIMALDTAAILALADYINQYGSIGLGFIAYLNELDLTRNITIDDVQDWKLNHTKYGKEHPNDCKRRYYNILRVLGEQG